MKRRQFLQSAGMMVAGGTTARGGERRSPGESPAGQETGPATVLVTSAECPLAEKLATALASEYQVRRLSSTATTGDPAPEAKSRIADALKDCAAVVCAAQPPAEMDAEATLDYRTRGVYDLLGAAVRQNVRLCIYLGSLETMAGYDTGLQVDETFRPVPAADAHSLSPYLGEFVCREFAREGKIRCVSLRLGHVGDLDGDERARNDPLALDTRDAIQAVQRALASGLAQPSRLAAWEVFHIQSPVPGARFATAKAQRVLGYKPRS